MEMQVLSELGQWLLTTPETRVKLGPEGWKNTFEACGSPREWIDFFEQVKNDPRYQPVVARYLELMTQFRLRPPKARRAPVLLPDF